MYFAYLRADDKMRAVVVKVPSKEAFQMEVIKRETQINALLKHPRIVEYVGFYSDPFQNVRIVSEFLAGGNLHAFLCSKASECNVWDCRLIKLIYGIYRKKEDKLYCRKII